jgi:asparagine synthase (glutamine-hydrolysing)
VVKELAERMLPREVVHRRKYGFGVPLGAWFKDERGLGRYLELFREKKYAERGYIDSVRVGKLVEEHLAGRCDHGDLLWALVNLELWHRTFLGQ